MRVAFSLSSDSRPVELGTIVHRCRVKSCGAVLPGKRYDRCLSCRRKRSEEDAVRYAGRKDGES